MEAVTSLAAVPALYAAFFAAQVLIDRATGWQLADAFGHPHPERQEHR